MSPIRKYMMVLALLPGIMLYAQQEQKLTIEQATVFLKGAELLSTATVSLPKGESEVVFTNVAGNVDQKSLTVAGDKDVTVMSSTFQNNYLNNENLSPAVKAIQDSIDNIKIALQQTQNRILVIDEQLTILKENRKVGGLNTGLSVAELQRYLDLVQTKNTTLLNDKIKLNTIAGKTEEQIAKLEHQLEEEQQKNYQPGGRLLVKFYNEAAIRPRIRVTYLVADAGWEPTYDIKAAQLNDSINLFVKANIYQNSGVEWKRVHIVLSTGNPSEGAKIPVLSPLHTFFRPIMEDDVNGVYQSRRGGSLNLGGARTSGLYIVDGVEVRNTKGMNMAQGATPASSYGMNDHISIENTGVNTLYDIDMPYTIASDGQNHLISVKQYHVQATYRYTAVPKMDNDAFLQADVINWEDLNLLPARTSTFFDGNYVGEGVIDTRNLKDTLTFSLGRDKKIIVEKETNKEKRSIKIIGTNVRDRYSYTISVRNTHKNPVHIVLQDQVPVSNDKDIVVEDRETDGGEYTETTGLVEWTLDIQPNETKKVKLSYTVKYPKGKTIVNAK